MWGARVPAADEDHPAGRPRDHPRRQQHDDRGVALRQADDRAAAVLGPVRQRPAGRRARLRRPAADLRVHRRRAARRRSTGCWATTSCAPGWPRSAPASGRATGCAAAPRSSRRSAAAHSGAGGGAGREGAAGPAGAGRHAPVAPLAVLDELPLPGGCRVLVVRDAAGVLYTVPVTGPGTDRARPGRRRGGRPGGACSGPAGAGGVLRAGTPVRRAPRPARGGDRRPDQRVGRRGRRRRGQVDRPADHRPAPGAAPAGAADGGRLHRDAAAVGPAAVARPAPGRLRAGPARDGQRLPARRRRWLGVGRRGPARGRRGRRAPAGRHGSGPGDRAADGGAAPGPRRCRDATARRRRRSRPGTPGRWPTSSGRCTR